MQDNTQAIHEINQVIQEVRKAIVGKDIIIAKVFLAILASGHVLIEDMPGVGKTTLALAFSKALSLSYKRTQFTPDVLPSDLTGFSMYQKRTDSFAFQPGSLFCQLFLADEINRTSSKTQSALLEAMEENAVTVDGHTYRLPQPFVVLATQNPIGSVGTQMLPESQMDRFMFQLKMGYPTLQEEIQILRSKQAGNPLDQIHPILDAERLLQLRTAVQNVYVSDQIYQYIATLVAETRTHPAIALGVSPRGTLALADASKAMAFMRGRNYVIPDDVRSLCKDVFVHRILLRSGTAKTSDMERILDEILQRVPMPRPAAKR